MTPLIEVVTRAWKTSRTPQTMIAALLAWSITVAPAAFARGSAGAARVFAVVALLFGLAGPLFLSERRRIGRHIGITGFVVFAALTWGFSLPALHPMRLSPFRAAIGTLAWAIFALSWREVWPTPNAPREGEAQAAPLPPRSSLPFMSVPILTVSILATLALVLIAFRTREPERGLVAQAVTVAVGAALITAASSIATTLGKERVASGRRFTPVVVRALMVLVVVAVGGALYIMFRT
ncbi:MAG: hypothetical protein IPK82_18380 [Polyangiaceae bacterium]|nr:hypothetical protein [Polyangiaceae bacterium]